MSSKAVKSAVAVPCAVIVGKRLGDSRGKRGLAMVDVTNGADVYMRLGASNFSFSAIISSCLLIACASPALGYASLPNYYFIRAEPRSEAKKTGSGDWIRTNGNTGMNRAL